MMLGSLGEPLKSALAGKLRKSRDCRLDQDGEKAILPAGRSFDDHACSSGASAREAVGHVDQLRVRYPETAFNRTGWTGPFKIRGKVYVPPGSLGRHRQGNSESRCRPEHLTPPPRKQRPNLRPASHRPARALAFPAAVIQIRPPTHYVALWLTVINPAAWSDITRVGRAAVSLGRKAGLEFRYRPRCRRTPSA